MCGFTLLLLWRDATAHARNRSRGHQRVDRIVSVLLHNHEEDLGQNRDERLHEGKTISVAIFERLFLRIKLSKESPTAWLCGGEWGGAISKKVA